MHAPVCIDVEDFNELVTAIGIVVAANALEELLDTDIGADDGIEDPFEAEVGYAFGALFEGVEAANLDCARWRKAFT